MHDRYTSPDAIAALSEQERKRLHCVAEQSVRFGHNLQQLLAERDKVSVGGLSREYSKRFDEDIPHHIGSELHTCLLKAQAQGACTMVTRPYGPQQMPVRTGVTLCSSDRQYPQIVNTRMCDHFKRGKCRYGDRCFFAHNAEQLNEAASLYYKTRTCRSFERGKCPHGDKCFYAHGADDLHLSFVVACPGTSHILELDLINHLHPSPTCIVCGNSGNERFSSKQLNLGIMRRCKSCVEKNEAVPGSKEYEKKHARKREQRESDRQHEAQRVALQLKIDDLQSMVPDFVTVSAPRLRAWHSMMCQLSVAANAPRYVCSAPSNTSIMVPNVLSQREILLLVFSKIDSFSGCLCWHVCVAFHRVLPECKVWWLSPCMGNASFEFSKNLDVEDGYSDGELHGYGTDQSNNSSTADLKVDTHLFHVERLGRDSEPIPLIPGCTNMPGFLVKHPEVRDIQISHGDVGEDLSGPIRNLTLYYDLGCEDHRYSLDAVGLAPTLESLVVDYERISTNFVRLNDLVDSGMRFEHLRNINLTKGADRGGVEHMLHRGTFSRISDMQQLIQSCPALRFLRIGEACNMCCNGSTHKCRCHTRTALCIDVWQPLEVFAVAGLCWKLSELTCSSLQRLDFRHGRIKLPGEMANEWNLSLEGPLRVLKHLNLSGVMTTYGSVTLFPLWQCFPCVHRCHLSVFCLTDLEKLLFCFDLRVVDYISASLENHYAASFTPEQIAINSDAIREMLQASISIESLDHGKLLHRAPAIADDTGYSYTVGYAGWARNDVKVVGRIHAYK